jgi:DNA-binding NtrC family response regulator
MYLTCQQQCHCDSGSALWREGLNAATESAVEAVNRALADLADRPVDLGAPGEGAVLIIEDCEPLLFYLDSALIALGYKQQFLAANLAEAQAAWTQHKHQISHVLLNYELPDGLGLEFASTILAERPDINVVVTSGYDINGIRDSAKTDRFQFLQKPFRLSELKEALEGVPAAKAFCA